MSRQRGAQGLVVVGLALLVLLLVADLFRTDSVVLGFLEGGPDINRPAESRGQRIFRVLLGGGPRR